ncbi:hypothetical protein [Actinocatenispora rupis]|uniref:Uncharacterized protein n=1 Tax=Actinocatenispora rupis TaxID=519421 RepID=A0A8J3J4V5_9ACTN|nr:hypothetical protein [Actinocatenispora rupis]GID10209.1 hypothetical protein Aru02nite_10980 [Actinocatenispora rupis]
MQSQHMYLGQYVRLSPATDAWKEGHRTGTITAIGRRYAHVRLSGTDRTQRIAPYLIQDYARPLPAFRRPDRPRCDCGCPVHHGGTNNLTTDGCGCAMSCASLPMLIQSPEVSSVGMLDDRGVLLTAIVTQGSIQWDTVCEVQCAPHADAAAAAVQDGLAAIYAVVAAAVAYDNAGGTPDRPVLEGPPASASPAPEATTPLPPVVPATLHPLAETARRVATVLLDLDRAWDNATRDDPRLDERLCDGYPFGASLDEVCANAEEWAWRLGELDRAQRRAGERSDPQQP